MVTHTSVKTSREETIMLLEKIVHGHGSYHLYKKITPARKQLHDSTWFYIEPRNKRQKKKNRKLSGRSHR
mgnify:CR=1 FL=1